MYKHKFLTLTLFSYVLKHSEIRMVKSVTLTLFIKFCSRFIPRLLQSHVRLDHTSHLYINNDMSKSMNSSRLVEDICNGLSKLTCIGI